jgi:hypothetical protein
MLGRPQACFATRVPADVGGRACAVAHQQARVDAVADERFARPGVAGLTMPMATRELSAPMRRADVPMEAAHVRAVARGSFASAKGQRTRWCDAGCLRTLAVTFAHIGNLSTHPAAGPLLVHA